MQDRNQPHLTKDFLLGCKNRLAVIDSELELFRSSHYRCRSAGG